MLARMDANMRSDHKELLALMEANQIKADARHEQMMADHKAW